MATKSKRIKPEPIRTKIDFEIHVDRVSFIYTELLRLRAERAAAVQAAQNLHVAAIKELETEQELKSTLAHAYAMEHRPELFTGKAKSIETAHSTYGFRIGKHTLVMHAKMSWEKVLARLESFNLLDYIRTKPEVNRERIIDEAKETGLLKIRDGQGGEIEVPLGEVGLRIEQEESFFIEPKIDGAPSVKGGAS